MIVAKAVTAVWILLWDVSDTRALAAPFLTLARRLLNHPLPPSHPTPTTQLQDLGAPPPPPSPPPTQTPTPPPRRRPPLPAALLLGGAMVARGEIGLLIIQLGFNDTSYVSEAGFAMAVWAILLNTLVGPVLVGALLRREGRGIVEGRWGRCE